MRFVNMTGDEFAALLKAAASEGRGGDTELVHVNKAEEKLLKEAGGAGTRNPKTGLKEYYTPEGGKGAGTGGDTSGRAAGARSDRGAGSRGEGNAGESKSGAGTKTGVRGAGGFMSPTGRLNDRADVVAAAGRELTDKEVNDISREWADRLQGKAGVSIDPVKIGMGLVGMVNPIAGIIGGILAHSGVLPDTSFNIGGGYRSVADLAAGIAGRSSSASGTGGNSRNGNSDKGNPVLAASRNSPTSPNAAPAPDANPTSPDTNKSPADVLLDKFKLPGINAPFTLTPYTIDQTQHNAILQQILGGRE